MPRIMGLDVGDKTIGVAASDPLGWTAQGIETIQRIGIKKDLQRLEEIIKGYEIEMIVVGLPKNMNGSLGPQSEKVLEFVERLKKRFNLEVALWDERLSTVAAERDLIKADVSRKKRKEVIDKMAAVYILQGYLDGRSK
ncbi:Holliday junction resolvase RuvX [Alkaliphilus peptidifermentans]|uniref:Putative pre-16S rRNA nuclease n=1 Tax=Alkaliphilus peptidifermentans DSM 18978 TaxID=1120976 RepID=A0A1G5KD39_9FIRM|nr:Holliday junction resolvase RuvX [Alkaliphilus peptidifermentans]SCY98161.1 putative holliday junction resolvase [Alkaliphilus peptidifermentans DSM 18978]